VKGRLVSLISDLVRYPMGAQAPAATTSDFAIANDSKITFYVKAQWLCPVISANGTQPTGAQRPSTCALTAVRRGQRSTAGR
jgi:hypothetical protein